MLLHIHQLSLEERIQKLNARRWKLLKWIASEPSPPDFISVSFFPCLLLRGESCQFSGINRIRNESSRYVYLQLSLCSLFSLLSVTSTGKYFLLLLSDTVWFFSPASQLRHLKTVQDALGTTQRATNLKSKGSKYRMQERNKKYDCFSGKIYWYHKTN